MWKIDSRISTRRALMSGPYSQHLIEWAKLIFSSLVTGEKSGTSNGPFTHHRGCQACSLCGSVSWWTPLHCRSLWLQGAHGWPSSGKACCAHREKVSTARASTLQRQRAPPMECKSLPRTLPIGDLHRTIFPHLSLLICKMRTLEAMLGFLRTKGAFLSLNTNITKSFVSSIKFTKLHH